MRFFRPGPSLATLDLEIDSVSIKSRDRDRCKATILIFFELSKHVLKSIFGEERTATVVYCSEVCNSVNYPSLLCRCGLASVVFLSRIDFVINHSNIILLEASNKVIEYEAMKRPLVVVSAGYPNNTML